MGFRYPVTIERKTGGRWNADGEWEGGSADTLTISASVQPLSAREYTFIAPEGDHTVRGVKLYTDVELYTDREKDWEADVLLWRDARWKVVQCDPFQSGVISHFRAYALEVIDRDGHDEETAP